MHFNIAINLYYRFNISGLSQSHHRVIRSMLDERLNSNKSPDILNHTSFERAVKSSKPDFMITYNLNKE